MSDLVAFVGTIDQTERDEWLTEISSELPEVKILAFEDLSKFEKKEVKVAIVANPDPMKMLQLPNLIWVQSLWAGVERLVADLPKATFEISRMVDPMLSSTMAEAVLAWVLYLHRDMPQYKHQQNEQLWKQRRLVETKERKIGILGLGKLGSASAKNLLANGFVVHGWSKRQANVKGMLCFSGDAGLKDMLRQTDILVCLLPLTSETENLLNHKNMLCLPKGASLINFSRGRIVDADALLVLLNDGHLNHAVLDVFPVEPLPENSALWKSKNITVLPHISAPTNIKSASKIASENVRRYFKTGEMPPMINRVKGY